MTTRSPTSAIISRLPLRTASQTYQQGLCLACRTAIRRSLHSRVSPPPTPKPTPFVPDVSTFLTLIGRNLSQHASKIESWDTLFRITSPQLRDLGIEPARSRKYLLRWRDKFRHGEFGIGGDAKFVGDGGAVECRLVELQATESGAHAKKASLTTNPGTVKKVLNVPWTNPLAQVEKAANDTATGQAQEDSSESSTTEEANEEESTVTSPGNSEMRKPGPAPLDDSAVRRGQPIAGIRYQAGRGIYGPFVRAVKGSHGQVGILEVKQGMWEHRQGHKVDGGERRKAEVRFKRRTAERRAART